MAAPQRNAERATDQGPRIVELATPLRIQSRAHFSRFVTRPLRELFPFGLGQPRQASAKKRSFDMCDRRARAAAIGASRATLHARPLARLYAREGLVDRVRKNGETCERVFFAHSHFGHSDTKRGVIADRLRP